MNINSDRDLLLNICEKSNDVILNKILSNRTPNQIMTKEKTTINEELSTLGMKFLGLTSKIKEEEIPMSESYREICVLLGDAAWKTKEEIFMVFLNSITDFPEKKNS